MRYLVTVVALALCACSENIASDDTMRSVGARGATNTQSSVTSNNSTSVTSSVNSNSSTSVTSSDTGSGATISSKTNDTVSSCSAIHNDQRCEVSCNTPQLAQCRKSDVATAPICICK